MVYLVGAGHGVASSIMAKRSCKHNRLVRNNLPYARPFPPFLEWTRTRVPEGQTFCQNKIATTVFHLDPKSWIFFDEWKWSWLIPSFCIFENFTSTKMSNLGHGTCLESFSSHFKKTLFFGPTENFQYLYNISKTNMCLELTNILLRIFFRSFWKETFFWPNLSPSTMVLK